MLVLFDLVALARVVPLDPSCSDVREAADLVDPPAGLAAVTPPPDRCTVSTTAELAARVVDCPFPDIVLEPGVYSPEGLPAAFLSLPQTRRLWGTTELTVLQFGVSLGVHDDTGLHGLIFDVDDPAHAVPIGAPSDGNTAVVAFWGDSRGVTIEDTEMLGHGVIRSGIFGSYADGATVARVRVQGFLRYGILLMQDDPASTPAVVRDVVVRDVGDPAWRLEPWCVEGEPQGCYAPGTAEHGIWLGIATHLQRAQVRDVWWAGIVTANCFGGVCDEPLRGVEMWDVDIDRIGAGSGFAQAGTGIGFERVTHRAVVSEFCVGPNTERGVHAEWNHGNDLESATALVIQHGVVSSSFVGISFGSGTRDSSVIDVLVRSADWAGAFLECCGAGDPDTCTTNVLDIDYDIDGECKIADGFYGGACECL